MPSWLQKLFGTQSAVESQRRNPVLEAAVQQSAEIYDRIPLRDFITPERRSEMARELFLEVNRICNARNPANQCREKYASAMLEFARYQVLMIRPAPAEDDSGLRGMPGITGEMHGHLVELFDRNDELRAAKFAAGDVQGKNAHWQLLQRLYWESYWLLHTINAARIELGDSIGDADWHRRFMHASCVNAEHAFRWTLELPSAFEESVAKEAVNAYSMFTDIVMSGAQDPAAEWREYFSKSAVPMPDSGFK